MSGRIELHLRCRVPREHRSDFLAFLREAIPFYESIEGVSITLLQDMHDDLRFIELVRYENQAAYDRDQERVANDPAMKALLDRWRRHLAEPPVLEAYRTTSP